jgi:serine/threonine-protein kinase HipA
MTSESGTAYVWCWPPGAIEPVVAGRLDDDGEVVRFTYGRTYLARVHHVPPIYEPELPLEDRTISPLAGMAMAGCIADAGPDGWGQRVITWTRGAARAARDVRSAAVAPAGPGPLDFLLESGSDRFGALDFQASPTEYQARTTDASLEELQEAAHRFDDGEIVSPELQLALLDGSSMGGARPKVLIDDRGRKFIAKFSRTSDSYPVVKAEGLAMELARRVGLDVVPSSVVDVAGRDVLLVDRFDRTAVRGERRMAVSALTILELDERWARYATYPDLADQIRRRFRQPRRTLHELFGRIVFNICVGNTDDHASNYAAFVEQDSLALTPAYDLCPQPRLGGEAVQAMAIRPDGYRFSRLDGAIAAAPTYQLTGDQARDVVERQIDIIRTHWTEAADLARLTTSERDSLWGAQILNPYAFEPEH